MKKNYVNTALLLTCVQITACDGDSDARDLRNRVLVASDNLSVVEITSVNDVIETNFTTALEFLAGAQVAELSYTADAVWSSSDPTVATVDSSGVVTGISDGAVTISGKLGPLSDNIALRVSSARLTAIEIGIPESVNECDSVPLTATGLYPADDNSRRTITDSVTWTVSDTPAVVGVISGEDALSRIFRSSSSGVAQITATRGDVSAQASLIINDNLAEIKVTPLEPVITLSATTQFNAVAVYSDSEDSPDITDNVSWSVSTNNATVDNTLPDKGSLNASNFGSVSLTANCGGVTSDTVDLTVGDASIVNSIAFQQSSPYEFDYAGQTRTIPLVAVARLQTTATDIITEDVDWKVIERSNNQLDISNSTGSKGQLTVRGAGTITVQIEYIGNAYSDESVFTKPTLKIVVN